MRWDAGPHGGFSDAEPWLPMGDPAACNDARQRADEGSILTLYRRLIDLRRNEPALKLGAFVPLRSQNDILAYKRTAGESEIMIALNIARDPRRWHWQGSGALLLSTDPERVGADIASPVMLRGDEGLIIRLH